MSRAKRATLEFDPLYGKLQDGLSAVLQIGRSLWVANDETTRLELLSLTSSTEADPLRWGEHQSLSLEDYFELPSPADDAGETEEADIEGLAYSSETKYLWLVGSHSLKRKKASPDRPLARNMERLADISADGNRFLLARIPLRQEDGLHLPAGNSAEDGRVAARLHGDTTGSDLTAALEDDEHLGPFLSIPGKDNGFDIEGLAVAGNRLFVGLRGPVLRGWAVVLEIEPEVVPDAADELRLREIGAGGRRYRKHFLDLGGLGIRDLCVQGDDLLILAGPTMDLDGPVSLYRWPRGAIPEGESLLFGEQLEKLFDVDFGEGDDHAEGLCLLQLEATAVPRLLIVYDAASAARKPTPASVEVDVFPWPTPH
ncbi:DUF3616 domain-containing protein [Pseudomonas sp. LABIM340]|uniref:DUF3616 domain-containing protein n=1 Tax=Pseudomonas nitroreducens TaxID=46680 RepID=A0A5R8ZTK4_PSENT|nr:DUF3616 domain-containing protein [Pseudomonas nitroreducens]TLP69738.1 DUF3616 domain-containing protein [Pseudomonas nitroreducens]